MRTDRVTRSGLEGKGFTPLVWKVRMNWPVMSSNLPFGEFQVVVIAGSCVHCRPGRRRNLFWNTSLTAPALVGGVAWPYMMNWTLVLGG